jgi:hypothetical protein
MAATEAGRWQDAEIDIRLTLSALWASATLCYLYGDFIAFYSPGALRMMMDGKMGSWPTTQELLLGVAIVMAFPAVMVALALALKLAASRWLNIIMGVVYTAIMLVTMPPAWNSGSYFYLYLGLVEVTLTSFIVWYAFTWPKQRVSA